MRPSAEFVGAMNRLPGRMGDNNEVQVLGQRRVAEKLGDLGRRGEPVLSATHRAALGRLRPSDAVAAGGATQGWSGAHGVVEAGSGSVTGSDHGCASRASAARPASVR